MDPTPLQRLADRQYGVFARRQARRLGFTAPQLRRLAARQLIELITPEVFRCPGTAHPWRQQLMIAILDAGPGALVIRKAAAQLWEVPGFSSNVVEVAGPRSGRRRPQSGALVRPRLLPATHRTTRHGLAVATPARMVCDLAAVVGAKRLDRAVDNSLSLGITTLDKLWVTYADLESPRRPWLAKLLVVLNERSPGYVPPASELEALYLSVTRAAGIEEPERQVDLGGDEQWIARVDFVYRRARLIVEVDGRRYHDQFRDRARDEARRLALEAQGWRVLVRRWDQLVDHPDQVVASLRHALASAA